MGTPSFYDLPPSPVLPDGDPVSYTHLRKLFHTHIGRVKPSDPPINIFFFTNYNIPTIPTQALSLRKKEIKASNDVIPHGKPLSLFLLCKRVSTVNSLYFQ